MTDKEIQQAREIVSRIPEQEKTEILIENEAIPELLKEAKKLARKK